MTPKEKAIELYNKYFDKIDHQDNYWGVEEQAKECALICVDEIINCDSFFKTLEDTKEFAKYWYEVQNEMNKL